MSAEVPHPLEIRNRIDEEIYERVLASVGRKKMKKFAVHPLVLMTNSSSHPDNDTAIALL